MKMFDFALLILLLIGGTMLIVQDKYFKGHSDYCLKHHDYKICQN